MCSLTRKFELQCTLIPCSDSLIINHLRLQNTYCLHGTHRIRKLSFHLTSFCLLASRFCSEQLPLNHGSRVSSSGWGVRRGSGCNRHLRIKQKHSVEQAAPSLISLMVSAYSAYSAYSAPTHKTKTQCRVVPKHSAYSAYSAYSAPTHKTKTQCRVGLLCLLCLLCTYA